MGYSISTPRASAFQCPKTIGEHDCAKSASKSRKRAHGDIPAPRIEMAFRSFCVVLSVFPNRNPLKLCASGGLMGESDDDLLSRTGVHYHWRGLVSRSCSGWEGVVPRRYVRQTVTCTARRALGGERQIGRSVCWFWSCDRVLRELPCLARL